MLVRHEGNRSDIRMGHVQPYNRTTIQVHPSTPQVNTPSTPSTPSTSKREIAKAKRLKALLSAIGANGSNLRALMESMQRKDRKGFASTYIVPNIEAGYIIVAEWCKCGALYRCKNPQATDIQFLADCSL